VTVAAAASVDSPPKSAKHVLAKGAAQAMLSRTIMPLFGANAIAKTALSGSVLALLLGVGLLPAGCTDGVDAVASVEGAPSPGGVATLGNPTEADPAGQTGSNGLTPPVFQASMSQFYASMQIPLLMPDSSLNPLIATYFASFTPGESPLPYLLKCGLPQGFSVPFDGELLHGMLNNTETWKSGPLSPLVRGDFFACMAVHLNVTGQVVPIRITGPAVSNAPAETDVSPFTFQESYWWSQSVGATTSFEVWPLPDLIGLCGKKISSEELKKRICGNSPSSCSFQANFDRSNCTETAAGITCGTKRVIKSWLQADDVPSMYRECTRRPPGGPVLTH
jgi:hypothetical protein